MRVALLGLACLTVQAVTFARVWNVPAEAPSIQAALNLCEVLDTVLVQPGVYNESLNAPVVPVTLIGAVSAFDNFPVTIDPSTLPAPDSISCLAIHDAPMQIDSIRFRNAPAMFPRRTGFPCGGIVASADGVVLRHCKFDSVYSCVLTSGTMTIANCSFHTLWRGCISSTSSLHVAESTLSGVAFSLLTSRQSLVADRCTFGGDGTQYLIHASGQIEISGCLFGPFDRGDFIRLYFYDATGRIANCSFEQFADESHGTVHLQSSCNGSIRFSNNVFRNVNCNNYLVAVNEVCEPLQPVLMTGNLFESCSVSPAHSRGVSVYAGDATIEQNSFRSLDGQNTIAAVHVNQDSTTLRSNIFIDTDYAVRAERLVDARFNYWGDSTGPYHPTLNPSGLGDEVSDSVLFEPWYPDTSFVIESADERAELPMEFSLSVFPNPFNSTARIELSVPQPFIASIELTNILGQRVRELHRGPVYGRETILLNANELASGLYFIRVSDVIRRSVTQTQKIVLIK